MSVRKMNDRHQLSTNMNKSGMNVVWIDILEMYSPLFNYKRLIVSMDACIHITFSHYTYMVNTLNSDFFLEIFQLMPLNLDHVVV